MKGKSFLWFLILSGSFLQAFASLSEKDSNASSNFLVRKKRIIDDTHNKDEEFLHQEIRYVVLLSSEQYHCTGSILAPHIILTAAHCVAKDHVFVISGIPDTETQRYHTVVNVIVHDHYKINVQFVNDLALIVVREPIDIRVPHGYNRAISIYNGTLPENAEGLASGWGDIARDKSGAPSRVRSILVPIMNHHRCHELVNEKIKITEKHICTFYPNREKCCWFGDSGGPLVYDGKLIGVFSVFHNNPQMADVFMNLLDPEYKMWVESWVRHIHDNSMHLH